MGEGPHPTPWRLEVHDVETLESPAEPEPWIIDAAGKTVFFAFPFDPATAQEICDAVNLRGRYRSQRDDAIRERVRLRRHVRDLRDLVRAMREALCDRFPEPLTGRERRALAERADDLLDCWP